MSIISLQNIHHILSYNKWANQRLIDNISKLTNEDYYKKSSIPFDNIHGILFHLFYYDAKKYEKLTRKSDSFIIEKQLSKIFLAECILTYSTKWLAWADTLMQINQPSAFLKDASKIVIDLSIHNNYHRGQINIITSFAGYKPESLDIFVYNDKLDLTPAQ